MEMESVYCPKCNSNHVDVLVMVWARHLGEAGMDITESHDGSMHYTDESSAAFCDSCHWRGKAGELVWK